MKKKEKLKRRKAMFNFFDEDKKETDAGRESLKTGVLLLTGLTLDEIQECHKVWEVKRNKNKEEN